MEFQVVSDGVTYSIFQHYQGRTTCITVGLQKFQADQVKKALENAYLAGQGALYATKHCYTNP